MRYEAPIGPVETALAEIWLDVLDLDRVSRNDNFFALGGHSLQAVYMLERMRQLGFNGDLRAPGAKVRTEEFGPGSSLEVRYGSGAGQVRMESFSGDAELVLE